MKLKILLGSIILSLLILAAEYSYKIGLCEVGEVLCRNEYRSWGSVFLFFPFLFIFSLLTYFAPDRIFQSWWKFARIAIPICFVLSAFTSYNYSQSTDVFEGLIYIPTFILIYGTFTIGSLWQIWKGWRKGRTP
jgi:hypothetical protein